MRLSMFRVHARVCHRLLAAGLFTGLLATSALASPPGTITVQGTVRDQFGNAVNGNQTLVISLYTVPSGGVALASETRQVTLTDGLFQVELDSLGDPDLYRASGGGNENWHFGVAVAGQPELMPRLRVATVPFAHISTGVEGDIETAPGALTVRARQDPDKHSELAVLSEPDSAVMTVVHSSTFDGSSRRYVLRAGVPLQSIMEIDDDGDSVPDNEIENIMVPGTSSVAIKTKGTGADKNRVASSVYEDSTVEITTLHSAGGASTGVETKTKPKKTTTEIKSLPSPGHTTLVRSTADEDSATIETSFKTTSPGHKSVNTITLRTLLDAAAFAVSVDTTDDSIPEGEVSAIVTPGTSSVAINTKGTGADKGRVISSTTPASALHVMGVDDDGDDVDDSEIEHFVIPGSSAVAIKTKGTGADKNRVSSGVYPDSTVEVATVYSTGGAQSSIESKTKPKKSTVHVTHMPSPGHTTRVMSSAALDTALHVLSTDPDGDEDPEGEIEHFVVPGTCSVAIKTKGTGADKNRVVSTTGPDSATLELASGPDGDPDGDVTAFTTPTSCGVAIKTKGTGADPNRVVITTHGDSAHVNLSSDDESISMRVRPPGGGLPGSSSLTLLHDEGVAGSSSVQAGSTLIDSYVHLLDDGVVVYSASSSSGMQVMDNSGVAVTVIDRLGNAAFSTSVGVGVSSTTHPIEHSSGAHLTAGGTWTNASDAGLKENFEEVDGAVLLDRLSQLQISSWNYKSEGDDVRHIGPTAQDFQKAFGVGSNGTSISTIDPSGIALAAIKELESRNRQLSQENDLLAKRLEALLERIDLLEQKSLAK